MGGLFYFLLSPTHLSKQHQYIILMVIFISTYILPIILLFILKKLKLINSFKLRSIEERKFPVLFLVILSFMLGKMLLEINLVNLLAFSFFGGSLALLVVYFLFSANIKISLHTLAIGSLIGFVICMSLYFQMNLTYLIAILFLLFGLLASSRLALKAHIPKEIYLGVTIGILGQFISYYIYNLS
ncbi:MAG: hypothetical protein ABFR05_02565 [Bacteroidota bacterium]